MKIKIIFSLFFISLLFNCSKDVETCVDDIEELGINQIQLLGSHNSYRIKTYQPIFDWAVTLTFLPEEYNPSEWDYTHIPIPEQFNDYRIRGLELDIYHDPQGGRFYKRGGNFVADEPTASGIPELLEPGFKIIHIADFDYMTHYFTFKSALQAVKAWSESHANHIPIIIMVEPKTETVKDAVGGIPLFDTLLVSGLPFTKGALDSIDMEIKMVFGEDLDGVLTPDDVRGEYRELEHAILQRGWPTLAETRGKVMFVTWGVPKYLEDHFSLEDRVMFTYSSPGNPECAFVKHDDPTENMETIQDLVQKGYMVRTRADAGTWEARDGDYSRMDDAFASGAQIISTDYYKADYRADTSDTWTDYHVQLPHNQSAVINPVNTEGYTGCRVFD
ncbi:MAG: hypothetical protein COA57_12940 [Flavobacteriales bacterium]|nr:MAG: hypothetical protein COA57_12940 [Flavobacteriales bacterium]